MILTINFNANLYFIVVLEGFGSAILGALNVLDSASSCQTAPPLSDVLGRDFSGVVSGVGPQVTEFKPGDEV